MEYLKDCISFLDAGPKVCAQTEFFNVYDSEGNQRKISGD